MKILILAYDWREMSLSNPTEELRRLKRDGLDPEVNTIHMLQIGPRNTIVRISDHVTSEMIFFPLRHMRPISDIFLSVAALFRVWKKKVIPDIVVSADASLLWWIRLTRGLRACIYINTLHRDLSRKSGKFARYLYIIFMESLVKGRIQHAMVISTDGYTYAKKYLQVSDLHIHFFTPQTFFHDEKSARIQAEKIRSQNNIPRDHLVLLTVSRLEKEKGIDTLIRAFAEQREKSSLVIVGEGSLRESLTRLVFEKGVTHRVYFIGAMEHDLIWPYYYASDVYVQPSFSEALGLSLLEAMLCKIPVAAFPVGGLCDSIGAHGERGFYLNRDEVVQSLSSILEQIQEPDIQLREMKERAYMYVQEKIKEVPKLQTIIL